MTEVSVSWLAKASRGRLVYSKGPKLINGVSTDSRTIREGECFIALKGKNFDGHDFVKECLSKKVTTFIVEDAFFSSNASLFENVNAIVVKDTYKALMDISVAYRTDFVPDKKIIAITGSSGKTTTKYIIAQLLSYKYKVEFSPKSYNNNVGVPLSILRINEDTDVGVLEVGMNRKGEIRKLSKIIMPDVGVITNIGYAHIEFLKTVKNIALAKSELFEGVKQGGVVFLNRNSRHLDVLELNAKRFQLDIRYFDINDARVIENRGVDGVVFEYDGVKFDTSIPGIHNVENLVCAFEIAKFFGIKISDLIPIVKNLSLPEMRDNVIRGRFTLIDDSYNANPDSMMRALDLLDSAKSSGKKIAVLGDMLELGEHSQKLHLQVADHILSKKIDYILCYGENFSLVHDYLIEKGMDKNNVISTSSINEIADILGYLVKDGDIVLVKGSRGMRLNEIASFLENKMKERA